MPRVGDAGMRAGACARPDAKGATGLMKGQWGKFAGYFLGTFLVTAAITFLPPLIGGGRWLPDLITREGENIDKLFWGLMWLCVAIFAIVAAVVVYSIVHFRAGHGDLSDGAHIHGDARMELAWIIIPSIIVFVIGILSYMVLEDSEIGLYDEVSASEKGAATMAVDVRGFSFGWSFRYEDVEGEQLGGDDATPSSELVLPVDEVVRFNVLSCSGKEALGRITEQTQRELASDGESHFAEIEPSICEEEWDQTTEEDRQAQAEEVEQLHRIREKRADGKQLDEEEQALWEAQPDYRGDRQFIDVNHAFWVPEARLKIDAVAGIPTYVQWKPTEVTTADDRRFQVVCTELCGTGHNAMRTDMCVVDAGTFDWWVGLDEEQRGTATCANLRLMSCLDDVNDHDAVLEDIAALSEEDPEATCDEAEEAAA